MRPRYRLTEEPGSPASISIRVLPERTKVQFPQLPEVSTYMSNTTSRTSAPMVFLRRITADVDAEMVSRETLERQSGCSGLWVHAEPHAREVGLLPLRLFETDQQSSEHLGQ